jgi:hypothetical protein
VYKPVDLAPKIQYFTLDVISDIAFGKAFGNLTADGDVSSYIKIIEEAFPFVMILATFPELCQIFFSRIFKPIWPKDTDKTGIGKLMGYVRSRPGLPFDLVWLICLASIARDLAAERFGPNKKVRRDMLGSFIRHGLTKEEAQSEALLQMYFIVLSLSLAC